MLTTITQRMLKETKVNLQGLSDNLYDLRDRGIINLKMYNRLKTYRDKFDVIITDIVLKNFK